jgi:hypothetical protein
MADGGVLTTIVTTLVKAGIEHGLPAGAAFFAGGGMWAAINKLAAKNPLNNSDFRITAEQTSVSIGPDPASAHHALVKVKREFSLKLRDDKKKGRFQIDLDLSETEGKWDRECAVRLDETSLALTFGGERASIKAQTPKLTRPTQLDIVLTSIERISKARCFYSLAVSNPKDSTKFRWSVEPSAAGVHGSARGFASSEDFDLIVVPPGEERSIHESKRPVIYFITWSEAFR